MKLGGLTSILKKVEKPCFTLHIRAVGCRYDVRLNDIPVDRHHAPSSLAADVPVNPSVFTGDNELAAVIFPAAFKELAVPDCGVFTDARNADGE